MSTQAPKSRKLSRKLPPRNPVLFQYAPSRWPPLLHAPAVLASGTLHTLYTPAKNNKKASDHDPSSFYPSFQLDCLRQPYGGPFSAASPRGSPTSTTMDDDDEEEDNDRRHASLRSMGSGSDDNDANAPSPCPARLQMDDGFGGGRRRGGGGGFAAALEEARGDGGGAASAAGGVPETPLRRPGSGARSRGLERGGAGRGDGSCSPVGGSACLDRWVRGGCRGSELLLALLWSTVNGSACDGSRCGRFQHGLCVRT